jgi:hypothetical protein
MEAPVFIREHARNIRHFVAELIGQYSGWPGAADSSANEFICAEITAAIARHDAGAWQPADQPPAKWRIVLVAVQYGQRKKYSIVVPGEYSMADWWIFDNKDTYRPSRRGETVLGWRDMPRYTPLEA